MRRDPDRFGTGWFLTSNGGLDSPAMTSHSFTLRSIPPVAKRREPGLNFTAFTSPSCASCRHKTHSLMLANQKAPLSVPSSDWSQVENLRSAPSSSSSSA